MNIGETWKHIKTHRFEYLKTKTNIDTECFGTLINKQQIKNNVEKFSQTVNVDVSEEIIGNLSRNDIQVGASMFYALNACPSFHLKLYWRAIYGGNEMSRMAMLASKIIKKEKGSLKLDAIKIFAKISSVLGFQHTPNKSLQIVNEDLLRKVTNHPVHILNQNGDFSPSSFIPFCSFGDRIIGAKSNGFEIPVCNIFKQKLYINQLCYETNLQQLKSSTTLGKQLSRDGFDTCS